ncbi:hypothetical protein FB451DRAFT_1464948 [Mycena latifolia]|nr:hypothetical protein FB451DRAFT_1464948 [Mycena latifolia]
MGDLYVDMEYPHIKYTADCRPSTRPPASSTAPPSTPASAPRRPAISAALARQRSCSGDHPSCARCLARGLVCEYAKEGRVRGPNRTPRSRHASVSASSQPHSPAPLPYSTLSPTGALTLAALGKPRRRRTATLPPGAAPPPLASTRPLALPNPKRLSLPAALDLRLLSGAVPPSAYSDARAYNGDGEESHRGSDDSYAGEVGYRYDAYFRALDGFSAPHPHPQYHSHAHHPSPHSHHKKHHHHGHAKYDLEVGYALDPARDSHHQLLDWHHQHLDSDYPHHHRLDADARAQLDSHGRLHADAHPLMLRLGIDAFNPRRPASANGSGTSATSSSSSRSSFESFDESK